MEKVESPEEIAESIQPKWVSMTADRWKKYDAQTAQKIHDERVRIAKLVSATVLDTEWESGLLLAILGDEYEWTPPSRSGQTR